MAARRGRDLAADGVCVLPMGGAMSVGRFAELLGPAGLDLRLVGLCDEREQDFYVRALRRADAEPDGLFVCAADLEDELIRALGVTAVSELVEAEGEARRLQTFLRQPAQQGRAAQQQLRRFLGTKSGRKIHYGRILVEALEPARTPAPLAGLFAALCRPLSVPADKMPIMSRIISYSTADKADVLAFLGAAEDLTADQRRRLGIMRERARQRQADLDGQDIDLGLSIPDASSNTWWPAMRARRASTWRAPTTTPSSSSSTATPPTPPTWACTPSPPPSSAWSTTRCAGWACPPTSCCTTTSSPGPRRACPSPSRIPWTDRTSARSRCPGPDPGGHRARHRVPRRTGRRAGGITLEADPGVVREKVPGPEGGDPVTAVYLVPFHRAELALAGQLRRLLRTDEDRMPGFRDVAWDKALGWLRGVRAPTSRPSRRRPSSSR
ncbi:hypothetical protein STENM223S_04540 [Streptomyces tendae]